MSRRSALPSVVELYTSPELAVLSVLESAVDVTLLALVAAYPNAPVDAEHVPIEDRAACRLVAAVHEVTSALDRYRLALTRAKERDRELESENDYPF